MRKKIEPQIMLGQKLIEDTQVNLQCRDAFPKLLLALRELYITSEYKAQVFNILENKILKNKKPTGRRGMDLWQIFVLAQARLCLNISYDRLYDLANNHTTFRQIMGIETDYGFKRIEIEYQNIIDNVTLLDDSTLIKINDIIVQMGHKVFKKKETVALCLKTDSFVVESNVHFPTDYNLLWDSARKSIKTIEKIIEKYPSLKGWRNILSWYNSLKNKSREISQAHKKTEEKKKDLIEEYLKKAKLFSAKLKKERLNFPLVDMGDLVLQDSLNYYEQMLEKHINLLERRVIKGEAIPHHEKIFSIFESYTEWIHKGKQYPNVELGKNLQITSDQYHLIVDYKVMENQVDKSTVIALADRLLSKFKIDSWSFDKGFYTKENKELLMLFIKNLIMPKKGKLNKTEQEFEQESAFKKLRNKHSAIESNINELEHKGLDKCPDKGFPHFKRYIAIGVCAYNLHKIGAEILKQKREQQKKLKNVA